MIGIDFDNTLAQYSGWNGFEKVGSPRPGAIEFVKALHELGFKMAIISARAVRPEGKKAIEEWVDRNGLNDYIEFVTCKKVPQFLVILDDRAVRFEGNYRHALKQILKAVRTPPPMPESLNDV